MKKPIFLLFFTTSLLFACGDKNNNADNCPEQAMPNPAKDINFVACKIDGKLWRDKALTIWETSAELDYANLPWCPQCATIISDRRIETNGCDTIYDHLNIDWKNNKIGNNVINFANFTQYKTKYKVERGYNIDLTKPYSLKITSFDSLKNNIKGTFFFTLKGDKTTDTLKVTEGVFQIGK